jgi:hypothetical protein
MSENKTQPTSASVARFISAIPDESRRKDAELLVKLMQSASGEEPRMWGPSIIGFGSHHYRYESGREGDMPLIGFSPRKAALVLYNALHGKDSADALTRLGMHSTGKGCLNIKKLSDVDIKALESILRRSITALRAKHRA